MVHEDMPAGEADSVVGYSFMLRYLVSLVLSGR
jgi:hypothetical protein